MKSIFEKILALQLNYSSKATSDMKKRGELIRNDLPNSMASIASSYKLLVEGRNGTGLNSRVPWARAYHNEYSPSAQEGWYVVYLIRADGSGFSCSLNQGTTTLINGAYITHKPELLKSRAAWARDKLRTKGITLEGLVNSIHLGKYNLATAYENGHVVGYEYTIDNIPNDQVLTKHLKHLLSLLNALYDISASSSPPGDPDPIILALEFEIKKFAGKENSQRAPKCINAEVRKAIEMYAMGVVEKHFLSTNWSVEDTHKNKPYDFIIRKGNKKLYVEVKGTTTLGKKVILTRNEVEHHQSEYPNTCLAIVREIILDTTGVKPGCSGGELKTYIPWKPLETHLKPMVYEYNVWPHD